MFGLLFTDDVLADWTKPRDRRGAPAELSLAGLLLGEDFSDADEGAVDAGSGLTAPRDTRPLTDTFYDYAADLSTLDLILGGPST